MAERAVQRPVIGWREWIALPDLGVAAIKAKVDTGARTSSLHAFDTRIFRKGRKELVAFSVHPFQRTDAGQIEAVAELLDVRRVRSSSGHDEERPVISTSLEILGLSWAIELTLTTRDAMGFRMLLGREAIRRRLCVDPARSYVNGRRSRLGKKLRPKRRDRG